MNVPLEVLEILVGRRTPSMEDIDRLLINYLGMDPSWIRCHDLNIPQQTSLWYRVQHNTTMLERTMKRRQTERFQLLRRVVHKTGA